MFKSFEALIGSDGTVSLREAVHLPHPCRAIVTIIDEPEAADTLLLSEAALAKDWNRLEEDKAWSHLQPDR